MNKFLTLLENYFMPIAAKLAGQRHLQALRDGIILTMPMIIIGSLFLIIAFLPYIGPDEARQYLITDDGLRAKILLPQAATFGMMGLIAAFGIAYRLAEKYDLDAITSGVISLCAFLLATPFTVMSATGEVVGGAIPTAIMGSAGLFVAILIAIASTEIYRIIVEKDIVIKMPEGVPPAVAKSFIALIPGFIVITLIWLVRLGIEHLHTIGFKVLSIDFAKVGSLHDIMGIVLGGPLGLIGGTLIGSVVITGLVSLLWSAGLHGMNIVGPIMSPIWLKATEENAAAVVAGTEPQNIFTQQFFEIFVNIGGSGATFGLVILMLVWAKSKQMKELGKLSTGPGVFMINEPVIFGMPIVMNPMLIIPFFLAPMANVVLTYFAMDLGLVAKTIAAVPWTTPPVISGFLATGSLSGAIMQIVNIVVGLFIYLPFFMMWDKLKKKEEMEFENEQTETK